MTRVRHCLRGAPGRTNVSHGPPSSGPSGGGCVMVSTAELSTGWREVQEHDRRRFEVFDSIGFADGGPDGRDWRGGAWAAEGGVHRSGTIAEAGGGVRWL